MATNNDRTRTCAASLAWSAAVAVAAVGVAGLGGCYERVTRATGFGADQYTVTEPYQRNSAVDDWIFGKQDSAQKSGSRIPPTPSNN